VSKEQPGNEDPGLFITILGWNKEWCENFRRMVDLPSRTLAYWTVSGFPVLWMYLFGIN
jgi:hypothetical protein